MAELDSMEAEGSTVAADAGNRFDACRMTAGSLVLPAVAIFGGMLFFRREPVPSARILARMCPRQSCA